MKRWFFILLGLVVVLLVSAILFVQISVNNADAVKGRLARYCAERIKSQINAPNSFKVEGVFVSFTPAIEYQVKWFLSENQMVTDLLNNEEYKLDIGNVILQYTLANVSGKAATQYAECSFNALRNKNGLYEGFYLRDYLIITGQVERAIRSDDITFIDKYYYIKLVK